MEVFWDIELWTAYKQANTNNSNNKQTIGILNDHESTCQAFVTAVMWLSDNGTCLRRKHAFVQYYVY